jgi:hypothetical protein
LSKSNFSISEDPRSWKHQNRDRESLGPGYIGFNNQDGTALLCIQRRCWLDRYDRGLTGPSLNGHLDDVRPKAIRLIAQFSDADRAPVQTADVNLLSTTLLD